MAFALLRGRPARHLPVLGGLVESSRGFADALLDVRASGSLSVSTACRASTQMVGTAPCLTA